MTPDNAIALAWVIEDALFCADLKHSELRVAHVAVKMSLRYGRTTMVPMLQKDWAAIAGLRETHVAEAIGWLLGKKILLLERRDAYRINTDVQEWIVDERVKREARARELQILQEHPEFWSEGAIRAGDPAVAFRDAEVAVAAEEAAANFRNPEVELPKSGSVAIGPPEGRRVETSEIRKSPIDSTGLAIANLLSVQTIGDRPDVSGLKRGALNEQLGRVEEHLGSSHIPWWRKHAGKSPQHVTALRQTVDDFETNRETVDVPWKWMVKVFKNKCRGIAERVHLFFW